MCGLGQPGLFLLFCLWSWVPCAAEGSLEGNSPCDRQAQPALSPTVCASSLPVSVHHSPPVTQLRLLEMLGAYCTRLILSTAPTLVIGPTKVDYHEKKVGLAWLSVKGNCNSKFPETSRCSSPCCLLLGPCSRCPPGSSSSRGEEGALKKLVFLHTRGLQTEVWAGTGQEVLLLQHRVPIPSQPRYSPRWQPGVMVPVLSGAQEQLCCLCPAPTVNASASIGSNGPVLPAAAFANINIYYREKYLQRSFPSWHSTKGHISFGVFERKNTQTSACHWPQEHVPAGQLGTEGNNETLGQTHRQQR